MSAKVNKLTDVKNLSEVCKKPRTWSVEFLNTVNRYFRTTRFIKSIESSLKIQKMNLDFDANQVKIFRRLVAKGYLPSSHLKSLELNIDMQKYEIKKTLTQISNESASLGLLNKIILSMCQSERPSFNKLLLQDSLSNLKKFWKDEIENLEIEIPLKDRELLQLIEVERYSLKLYSRGFITNAQLQRDKNVTKTSKIFLEETKFSLQVAKEAILYCISRLKKLEAV